MMKPLIHFALSLFFSSLSLMLLFGCDMADYRFRIQNKTAKTIYYRKQRDTVLTPSLNDKMYGYRHSDYAIRPDTIMNIGMVGSTDLWLRYVRSSRDSTMSLFIFSKDTLEKYHPDTICKYKMYLKRYDLKEKDLDSMKWKVVFDGK
jgi:hypothetical protein